MPRCPELLTRSCLMLGMFPSLVAHALAEDQSPTTPEAVWADFDPRKEPLEIEVTNRWAEHGSILTEFTFTGMTHEGSKVRVYALFSIPEGKDHLPGILHIHGGGQTVNPQWLRFWNDRGLRRPDVQLGRCLAEPGQVHRLGQADAGQSQGRRGNGDGD